MITDMKKFLLMVVATMMVTMGAKAQKIQTVDKDGQPIPNASIIAEDGKFIGTTDLNGVLNDVKGAEVVSITHVAYQPKKVKVGEGGKVVLEDADFGLPEITVTKKSHVYVQTYYRLFYMDDDKDSPVCFFRAGVLNNSYERQKKDLSSSEDHMSVCNKGLLKAALNTVLGSYITRIAGLRMKKVEARMKDNYKELGVTFTPNGPNKQVISDKYGVVGSVTDNQDKGERRYSMESASLSKHRTLATGSDKKIAKAEKKEERQKDRVDQDFIVYRIDEKGNYSPEDLVMQQAFTSYYDTKNNCNTYIMVQVFTTDRAYVTKDELKQMKKDNKMKMTYQNILKFERDHKIPALSPKFQQRIQELAK